MKRWESIPGETPIEDISGLKIKGVRNRQMLNAAEAENIRVAIFKYLSARPSRREAPFDLKWFKKLHGEMFGRVWSWGGELRKCELNLGVAADQIEVRLHGLVGDLEFWQEKGMATVEQAAMLHHQAVSIHPFLNGNGRWAWMLANIWLKVKKEPLTNWPEEHIGGESVVRGEYLRAVRAADGGDYGLLVGLHRRFADMG